MREGRGRGERVTKSEAWPDNPRALAGRLRRAATFLRKVDIEMGFEREGRARTRIISITTQAISQQNNKARARPSAPSALMLKCNATKPPGAIPAAARGRAERMTMETDDEIFVRLQQRAPAIQPAGRRQSKARKDTFAMVPLWWIEQAARATENPRAFVLIWLLHLSWKARSMTFPVQNAGIVKRGGSRWAKYGVLDDLEAAGLITVERRPGKTPIVTLVCL